MAIGKIEKTGISVRRGKVQLRFSFYLELGDARYDEHHVQVTVFPNPDDLLDGYPGELEVADYYAVGSEGSEIRTWMIPTSLEDYDNWIESLPKKWQNNPFHNHFIRVSPDATDKEIRELMRESLAEFYGIWSKGEDILKVWKSKREEAGSMSPENIERCELRGLDIANRASAFERE